VAEATYPGSKQPVKQYLKKEAVPPVELGPPFRQYRIRGQDKARIVNMYTVGQLAEALGRKAVTIRRWENEGVIPVAPFTAPSEFKQGTRRLYSEAHVLGIIDIAREEGILDDLGKKVGRTNFRDKTRKLFEELLLDHQKGN
jgi:hypothetical protein